ncbi:hypothetical protein [Paenibacillus spongiae]|uniref:Uncharacterized protein n=1 Tax=Paenibacillus spongiae TaxID=2909671 RepID=A0ABY5S6G4_9BACL|nr:hypothetical protein [Paenibacillus spongiae]UVI29497.1 hypothetical protein L1F29_29440 [Paenibacillus spongiae]
MDEEWMEAMLPAHVQRQLDQLLESWAEQIPTPQTQFDLDYDHICMISNELSYEWWQRLYAQTRFNPLPVFPAGWPFKENAG